MNQGEAPATSGSKCPCQPTIPKASLRQNSTHTNACVKDDFCENCLTLQSIATRFVESQQAQQVLRKENKTLHLYILSLSNVLTPMKRKFILQISLLPSVWKLLRVNLALSNLAITLDKKDIVDDPTHDPSKIWVFYRKSSSCQQRWSETLVQLTLLTKPLRTINHRASTTMTNKRGTSTLTMTALGHMGN